MEATALSVGKSVLDGALGYAKSAFAEEVALQLGIQRDHAFISDELEMMRSFMMEAHEERDNSNVNNSKVVKTWVKQVRDTAYDVEDCLQDFAVRLENPPPWWLFFPTLLERRRVAKQMKELRAQVEDVSNRNMRYRLSKGFVGSKAAAGQPNNLTAEAIFGVDDARHAARLKKERVDLVQLISNDDNDDNDDNEEELLKVIAVWGTGGDIGQTSVVRAAYEHPDVQSRFLCRAWVRVMHPFSPKGFVQSLVDQFHAAQGVDSMLEMETEKTSAQDLAQEFNGYVNGKRCLVVLNDLSTIEEWDRIKRCFLSSNKGSRIVVLTSQVEVASLCAGQDSQVSELKQLSADQTLYAFYNKGSDQNRKDSAKPVSSSDVATTSTYYHSRGPSEITEDQPKDLDETKVVKKSFTRIRTSVGAMDEAQLIGREKEISKIIELISNKNSQHGPVISVWGMGGLGKTTLANGIYQSPKLSDMFENRAFVTIMRPFNPAVLLMSLVERLHEKPSKDDLLNSRTRKKESLITTGVKELTEELKRILATKSFLIVLDDLSSIEEWKQIIQDFYWMGKRTQIIVTTREENIARHCSGKDGIVHNLEVLNEEDALNLFTLKVFGTDTEFVKKNPELVEEVINQIKMKSGELPILKATDLVKKNPELVEEANKILKKCDGLPLAIVTIGGYLESRPKTRDEWRKLNENISAELEMNPELETIRTVLDKSYDGLPYDLKSCFLYLSIFPEDHIISRRRLVRRWTAEGYSSERRGKSANEVAEKYFTDLKNRSMILPSQHSDCSRRSIDSCKVHDLIREIAISKSMEENIVYRLEEGSSLNTHGSVRHLSISSNWKGDQNEFQNIVDLTRIRSLTVFGKWRPFFISDKMRFLRVLDLEDTYGLGYHDLDHIGRLLHLKYLSLRRCDNIFLLPDSLGNLRELQTLDIRDTEIWTLPKTIIKLRKLQYIHASSRPRASIFESEDENSLRERCLQFISPGLVICIPCCVCCVPSSIEVDGLKRRDACNLACCVFFPIMTMGLEDELGVVVPRGIWKLKDLHTLRDVNVGRGSQVLKDIKRLTGLRKLGVTSINKKNGQAFCSAISNLRTLESLSVSVRSAGKPGLSSILDGISSPPENLQSLKLYGNLESLPTWIERLQHLVKLKLSSTRLSKHDTVMEFLGKLPKLEILCLCEQLLQDEELCFKSVQAGIAFRSLRLLRFADPRNIKSIKFEEGAVLPKLERLHVTGSIKKEIAFSGLEFLRSLSEVQLSVYFPLDWERIVKARDPETEDKIRKEETQEAMQKEAEFKKKIRDQLVRNTNEPILITR